MTTPSIRMGIFHHLIPDKGFAFGTDILDGTQIFLHPGLVKRARWLEEGSIFKFRIDQVRSKEKGNYVASSLTEFENTNELIQEYVEFSKGIDIRLDFGEVKSVESEHKFGFVRSGVYDEDIHYRFSKIVGEKLKVGDEVVVTSLRGRKGFSAIHLSTQTTMDWIILAIVQACKFDLFISKVRSLSWSKAVVIADKFLEKEQRELVLNTAIYHVASSRSSIEILKGVKEIGSFLDEEDIQGLKAEAVRKLTNVEITQLIEEGDQNLELLSPDLIEKAAFYSGNAKIIAMAIKNLPADDSNIQRLEDSLLGFVSSLEDLQYVVGHESPNSSLVQARFDELLLPLNAKLAEVEIAKLEKVGLLFDQVYRLRKINWAKASVDERRELIGLNELKTIQRRIKEIETNFEDSSTYKYNFSRQFVYSRKIAYAGRRLREKEYGPFSNYSSFATFEEASFIIYALSEDALLNYSELILEHPRKVIELFHADSFEAVYNKLRSVIKIGENRSHALLFRMLCQLSSEGSSFELIHSCLKTESDSISALLQKAYVGELGLGTKLDPSFQTYMLAYAHAKNIRLSSVSVWSEGWSSLVLEDQVRALEFAVEGGDDIEKVYVLFDRYDTPIQTHKQLVVLREAGMVEDVFNKLLKELWKNADASEKLELIIELDSDTYHHLVGVKDLLSWAKMQTLEQIMTQFSELSSKNLQEIFLAYGVFKVVDALYYLDNYLEGNDENVIVVLTFIANNLDIDNTGVAFRSFHKMLSRWLMVFGPDLDKAYEGSPSALDRHGVHFISYLIAYAYAHNKHFHHFENWCKGLVYLNVEDQLLCLKRLAMDKRAGRVNINLQDLNSITRVDVDIANMAFNEHSDVLDISTHLALRWIQSSLSGQEDIRPAGILELAYSKLINEHDELQSFQTTDFLHKCKGRKWSFIKSDVVKFNFFIKCLESNGRTYFQIPNPVDDSLRTSLIECCAGQVEVCGEYLIIDASRFSSIRDWGRTNRAYFTMSGPFTDIQRSGLNDWAIGSKIYEKISPEGNSYCEGTKSLKPNEKLSSPFHFCRGGACYGANQEPCNDWSNYSSYRLLDVGLAFDSNFSNKYHNLLGVVNRYNAIVSRLKCTSCLCPLYPFETSDFHAYRVTKFRCRNENCSSSQPAFVDGIDVSIIYLNHCWNHRCENLIIDSRESKKCNEGMYICSSEKCGHCCHHIKSLQRVAVCLATGANGYEYIDAKVKAKSAHEGGRTKRAFCYKCGSEMQKIDSDGLLWRCPIDNTEYSRRSEPVVKLSKWHKKVLREHNYVVV